jgi:predicted nucleotidyltransferase
MNQEQIIDRMVRRIAEMFHPEKIILFGSMATQSQTSDSDVDLLVVMREVDDRRKLRVEMHRAVTGLGLPKDIIILTAEEFERKRKIPGTIAYPADREGKVLYAE